MRTPKEIRNDIIQLVEEYDRAARRELDRPFQPGQKIPYSSRVYDHRERTNLVDSALEFWLTSGRYCAAFETGLANYLGTQSVAAVNSGSSANLLAFMALTSPLLGDRRINRGDEVITVAASFPTTVSSIINYGAVPVFVDVEPDTLNIDANLLEMAFSPKTRAVMLAHTLGNPFNVRKVKNFCDHHHLWLIEDNCDALGAEYDLGAGYRKTGTLGDIGTSSFYPAHHITMGEGGAVYTSNEQIAKILFSMRDWGRDCVCPPGHDNTCGHRFDRQFGELPMGYDHKYVYSHFGYNLKITDMQAAIGCAQLEKLPGFVQSRRQNWDYLYQALAGFQDQIILPRVEPDSLPSWFGFAVTLREGCGTTRSAIVDHLEKRGIQTRNLFSGNLVKHPCFDDMRKSGTGYRIVGELKQTDRIMNHTFWIGVYPGLNQDKLEYMASSLVSALRQAG